ncbi:MAG: prephenate dehydrogenase [Burkholderiaceae bacterium]
MFARVAILGSGLIGGSFALALRRAGLVQGFVAYDRDPAAAARARELGIIDTVALDARQAVAGCDFVVIAAPVAQTESILDAIAPHLEADAIVTDVGSTKRDVIAAARRALGASIARFVPGHPIAGREVHGPDAALADLFIGKRVLLTPLAENNEAIVARVRDAWIACGALVELLDADAHDQVLSAVSHLPHLLAYALVAQIADAPDAKLKFAFAGGGFRDFTRIAASSPEMWRDITIANRDALLDDLDGYRAGLDALRAWIATRDRDAIEAMFKKASAARSEWGDRR